MSEPVVIVVDGMINPAKVFASEAQVHGSDAEMVEKHGVVAARAKRLNAQVSAGADLVAPFSIGSPRNGVQTGTLPYRHVLFMVWDIVGHAVHKFFKCVR